MELDTIMHFMGWSLLINIGFFLIASFMLMFFRGMPLKMHSKLFGVDEEFLKQSYFTYIGNYKLLIIVFNLVPYMVLRLVLN